MSERAMRRDIVKRLKLDGLDAIAVENPCLPGTPDVECIHGWIELKQLPRWPKTNGPIKIPHFSPQQRIWLRRRWQTNQTSWLLLRVTPEWLLFDGETAARVVGLCAREELYRNAHEVWRTKTAMKKELAGCLSRRQI
jgi:hypothetical protein